MNERIKDLAEQAGFRVEIQFDMWCAYQEELERFAELVRADERDLIAGEFFNCLQSDLEHGVKCLNETASSNFDKQYPALSKFCYWIQKERTE
jgi:hypothetical protein